MLWYKSWLDTRWRFLIGLAILLACSPAASSSSYPHVAKLLPTVRVDRTRAAASSAGAIQEALELSATYRGYVWSQWFRQNLMQMGTLFAVLLGSGSLLSRVSAAARCSRSRCRRRATGCSASARRPGLGRTRWRSPSSRRW